MQSLVISDTSCIILFDKINQLHILKNTFDKVYTTPEVALEFGNPLPEWFEIIEPDSDYSKIAEIVDKGEASAIELTKQFLAGGLEDTTIILDDLRARKYALREGLKVIGSLGVILLAKQQGVIDFVRPVLKLIKQTNFRISEKIEKSLLLKAGE